MSAMWHLVRHAQASFGAADYDKLSELGHRQSRALGAALKHQGVAPDAVFIGSQRRHRETWVGIAEGLGVAIEPELHTGLNEFDFAGLLEARFRGRDDRPDDLHNDRRTHFRILRDTVLEWQRGEIDAPPESWQSFSARVRAARAAIEASGARAPLAVSSGGAIGQTVRDILSAPPEQMILLQLQIKNCAVARIVLSRGNAWLNGFNETPHIHADNQTEMLTYS